MNPQPTTVLTVGHSTLTYDQFLTLIRSAGVTAIADVRTSPYSRYSPQFNADVLRDELKLDDIAYVFLGRELGGRPKGKKYYCDGVADYEKMATAPEFKSGLQRVIDGAQKFRIALMCSEQDPLDCHRCLLVSRALNQVSVEVSHILPDASIATHAELEQRLLDMAGRSADDLFASPEERLILAYRERGRAVAFVEPDAGPSGPMAAE